MNSTLAAKEIVCIPIRYNTGELVYESEQDWMANPRQSAFVDRTVGEWDHTPVVGRTDDAFKPMVYGKTPRDIDLAAFDPPEFGQWAWMSAEEIQKKIVKFKLQTYEKVFAYLDGL